MFLRSIKSGPGERGKAAPFSSREGEIEKAFWGQLLSCYSHLELCTIFITSGTFIHIQLFRLALCKSLTFFIGSVRGGYVGGQNNTNIFAWELNFFPKENSFIVLLLQYGRRTISCGIGVTCINVNIRLPINYGWPAISITIKPLYHSF